MDSAIDAHCLAMDKNTQPSATTKPVSSDNGTHLKREYKWFYSMLNRVTINV